MGTDASRGQPEVEDLHPWIAAGAAVQDDVGGFQVTMNDVLLVRGVEGVGDLPGDGESLRDRHRAAVEAFGECGPFDEFEHEHGPALEILHPVDRTDVRVVQGREQACFAREARTALGIGDEDGRQHLDRNLATELAIASAIHFSHPASAKRAKNAIRAELLADLGGFAGSADFHRSGRDNGRGIGVVAHEGLDLLAEGSISLVGLFQKCDRFFGPALQRRVAHPGKRRLETLGILRRRRVQSWLFGRLPVMWSSSALAGRRDSKHNSTTFFVSSSLATQDHAVLIDTPMALSTL